MNGSELERTKRWFIGRISILAVVVIIIWVLEIVDSFILMQGLNGFGIRPREMGGLLGILFAPFLHGDFAHLASNTLPFAVLGWFTLLRSRLQFFMVSIISILVGGAGTWLIGGGNTVHLGLSSVVFGYLGFLLLRGFFERSWGAILLSILTGVLYGGLVFGVLPGQVGISWEGHLFGFVGGVLAARLLTKRDKKDNS